MASSHSRGLRVLFGLAGLFFVVAAAWFAQEHLVGQLQEQRDRAPDLLSEGGTERPYQRGWGRVVIGAPSGVAPRARKPKQTAPADRLDREPAQQPQPSIQAIPLPPPRWPADLELIVRPGQSLSKIAAAEYGRATDDLVQRLASYNGLADANKLRAGQPLLVPTKQKLLAQD